MESDADNASAVAFMYDGRGTAAWYRHVLDTHPEFHRFAWMERLANAIPFTLIAVLVSAAFIALFVMRNRDSLFLAFAICIAFAIPMGMYFVNRGHLVDWLKRARESARPVTLTPTPMEVLIERDGLRFANARTATVYKWRVICGVVRLPGYIAVMTDDCGFDAVVVPRAAFSDDQRAEVWADEVETHINRAGSSTAARVQAFLDGRAVGCVMCGYSLSGLREPACPECGTSLTVQRLRGWEAFERPWTEVYRRNWQ